MWHNTFMFTLFIAAKYPFPQTILNNHSCFIKKSIRKIEIPPSTIVTFKSELVYMLQLKI